MLDPRPESVDIFTPVPALTARQFRPPYVSQEAAMPDPEPPTTPWPVPVLFRTEPVTFRSGACLPLLVAVPIGLFGVFSVLMGIAEPSGGSRIWFVLSGCVALALAVWLGLRLARPKTSNVVLQIDREATVVLFDARRTVVMPTDRLASVVFGTKVLARTGPGQYATSQVIAFLDADGTELASESRSSFAPDDLRRLIDLLRQLRPELPIEHH